MIELEVKIEPRHTTQASDTPPRKINCLDFGLDKLHVTKNATEWIDDIAGIKVARGDLVQHWREQNEILATDQHHFDLLVASQRFIQVHRCAQPGESASQNDDASLFHSSSASANNWCRILSVLPACARAKPPSTSNSVSVMSLMSPAARTTPALASA